MAPNKWEMKSNKITSKASFSRKSSLKTRQIRVNLFNSQIE